MTNPTPLSNCCGAEIKLKRIGKTSKKTVLVCSKCGKPNDVRDGMMNASTPPKNKMEERFKNEFCQYRDPRYKDDTLLVAQFDKGDGMKHWQAETILSFIHSELRRQREQIEKCPNIYTRDDKRWGLFEVTRQTIVNFLLPDDVD